MSESERAEVIAACEEILGDERASGEEQEEAQLRLVGLICDADPDSERAARQILQAMRLGKSRPKGLRAALSEAESSAESSARPLLQALRLLAGDETAEDELLEVLGDERIVADGLLLDRILTAIDWTRSERLVKAVKRLVRRLEGGRIGRLSLGTLERMNDFVKSFRKASKGQKQQLADLFLLLGMDADKQLRTLRPFGAETPEDLRSPEAAGLVERLTMLARRTAGDRITAKQLGYIRKLVTKLGLGEDGLKIIASEAGGCEDIAELSKEQASEVIDWLVQKTGGTGGGGRGRRRGR